MVLILLDGGDKAAMVDMPYEDVDMNKGATAGVVTDKSGKDWDCTNKQ